MTKESGRKKLGEILVDQGSLSPDKLKEALAEQEKKGGLLGEILVRRGLVSEENIVIALATQFNFPYLPIENFEVNPQVIKLVPPHLATRYVCVPIDRMQNILTVVMSDPQDAQAIDALTKVSGCRIQVFVSTVTEIKRAIQRHYHISMTDESTTSQNISQVSFKQAAEKGEA